MSVSHNKINIADLQDVLRSKLDPFLSDPVCDSPISVDLADIYEISVNYKKLVEEFIDNSDIDSEAVDTFLCEIHVEVIEHFGYHFASLKKILPKYLLGLKE